MSLPPNIPSPQSNHERTFRQVPTEGHSMKYQIPTPHNSQGHQKQGKSESQSQPRGAYRNVMTKCDMRSWNWKRKFGKN